MFGGEDVVQYVKDFFATATPPLSMTVGVSVVCSSSQSCLEGAQLKVSCTVLY